MSNKDNGGPAFPCSENGTSHTIAMAAMLELPETATAEEKDKVYIQTKAQSLQGMSLRDYFAAKAMGGMIANVVKGHVSYGNTQDLAVRAYEVADEMLAARGAQ